MAEKQVKSEVEDPKLPVAPKLDPRIDENVDLAFQHMGFKKPYPESLLMVYASFRRRKDMLRPGLLTPEGFAAVATISDLLEGVYSPKE